ncbi:efflux RND transporter periplasmic adaptor subunit [Azomonas macrocytogenes]|uniref:Cu(I)/Ag(I) efflux system membrane fusion protein n=1 Tax=Azomonas macrocytogenes TaxID=69962 RepID=A0A839T6P1_AZOMA|nr:efflux RND transporter periplasmic adaptor subunit [Azomonas macrocytogenes]MBB3103343.1 Cu(I)/Ag(I) efflux system membrane fusion protein [Azomonas macrocytogenes]
MNTRLPWLIAVISLLVALAAMAYAFYPRHAQSPAAHPPAMPDEPKVLYWYDPMAPQQHFDRPGKSPFMDMDLVPRYAEGEAESPGIRVDANVAQNLGMRLARVTQQHFSQTLDVSGVLTFDARNVALVQARSNGFVERVYARAPEDLVAKGAPLADLLVPEWGAVQEEFLALRGLGQPALLTAARQRMRLAGMPGELIARVEKTGKVQAIWTVTAPIAGVLESLEVREGMTLVAGQPLARINGLSTVWLEIAVPEAQSAGLAAGQTVEAHLPALPGEILHGRIAALLPLASLDSRSVRIRVELPNTHARLRPGMTAQVQLQPGSERSVLVVPSEAVIRTGKRNLVMLAEAAGRYRPVEIRIGRDTGDFTEVLDGLAEGQQVVASGQFLLDSEASLRGLGVPSSDRRAVAAQPALHESEGTIVGLEGGLIAISHGPFKSLGMPGMSMPFPLADPALATGLAVGDRVRFAVEQTDDGLLIRRIEKLPAVGHEGHQP